SAQTLSDLGQLATQFDSHGRSLAEAVSLIDRSNLRTEGALDERRESLETLAEMLDTSELDNRLARFSNQLDQYVSGLTRGIDIKADDLEQRLSRFSGALDQTLESAGDRTREIARIVAESTTTSTRAISDNFEAIRAANEDEYKHTLQAMRVVYDQTTDDAQSLFNQAAQRFAGVLQELKQMAAEMKHELDSTRTELRKGILELPQETAESAAQMRRVIVDQIEALAELNRIVVRHGRDLDTVEPTARRADPVDATLPRREAILANSNSRAEPPRPRGDHGGPS